MAFHGCLFLFFKPKTKKKTLWGQFVVRWILYLTFIFFFIYAPINVKPHEEGRGEDPGELDIVMEARVKFPTYWMSIFRPWSNFFYQSEDLIIKSQTMEQRVNVQIPTQGKALLVNFGVSSPTHPPLPWSLTLIGALLLIGWWNLYYFKQS